MKPDITIDPNLTRLDALVLKNLLLDIDQRTALQTTSANGDATTRKQRQAVDPQTTTTSPSPSPSPLPSSNADQTTIEALDALNNPEHKDFDPAVFVIWDLQDVKLPAIVDRLVLQPYIKWARTIVRTETDVLMLTHLILYFTTSVPSALYLFYRFSWLRSLIHLLMTGYYAGTYTTMMHQHIHMRGILAKKYAWFDYCFPFLTDPLMGHTWNSYFYHHVKHHHVEGNGPDDLSSTLWYQRDDIFHFLHYLGRFFFFIWLDLPLYFLRKNKPTTALNAAMSELSNYAALYYMAAYVNFRATLVVLLAPFLVLRVALMVGNWGQHAFVDEVDPDSDFRSSVTLIDVASNRFCFNDGYHTSHHLNPMRHWRQHPAAFLRLKERYAKEGALVFTGIDYIVITIKLMQKDYMHLANCVVPIGSQIGMSVEEIAAMLKLKTRQFTTADVEKKFRKK